MTTRFEELLDGYRNDSLGPEDLEEFLAVLEDDNSQLESIIPLSPEHFNHFDGKSTPDQRTNIWNNISKELKTIPAPKSARIGFRYLLAAASVLLVIGTGIIWWRSHPPAHPTTITHTLTPTDLQPGSPKATLTLSNGQEIQLDSTTTGAVAQESKVNIEKAGTGTIRYDINSTEKSPDNTVAFNTLKVPKGGVYTLVLADHSVVYLNSASSLKFPASFSPRTPRTVELEGEAYFVVRHDPASPFQVKVKDKKVEALGTTFEINAYPDEPAIKATLIGGMIRASTAGHSILLHPGQQATFEEDQISTKSVDTTAVIAWKNGEFRFKATSLSEVMKQLGRWYDVNVSYDRIDDTAGGGFTAVISRSLPASEVLKVLEYSGYHFRIADAKNIDVTKTH